MQHGSPISGATTLGPALTAAAVETEWRDNVLGVGTSMTSARRSHDSISTIGITESVIIDRGNIKTTSEQCIAAACAGIE
jgi:hypothetical protein